MGPEGTVYKYTGIDEVKKYLRADPEKLTNLDGVVTKQLTELIEQANKKSDDKTKDKIQEALEKLKDEGKNKSSPSYQRYLKYALFLALAGSLGYYNYETIVPYMEPLTNVTFEGLTNYMKDAVSWVNLSNAYEYVTSWLPSVSENSMLYNITGTVVPGGNYEPEDLFQEKIHFQGVMHYLDKESKKYADILGKPSGAETDTTSTGAEIPEKTSGKSSSQSSLDSKTSTEKTSGESSTKTPLDAETSTEKTSGESSTKSSAAEFMESEYFEDLTKTSSSTKGLEKSKKKSMKFARR